MLKIVQFEREIFTLSPVAYITIDVKALTKAPAKCTDIV